jgi:hypothetical protein
MSNTCQPKQPTIISITEAFSMQPETFSVKTGLNYDKPGEIKRFEKETRQNTDGTIKSVVVGYDHEDQKVMEYMIDSINIHYKH